ncbi:hypothetical protein MHU86_1015 [Fragilaria crotonensis]|nr:hypothetical protein MHU86_1015 [Fragilaria crotonensis]
MGILTKTLAFIKESLESELQKNALLKISRVCREKIHAANRKHDQVLKAIYHFDQGTNSNIRDQQLQRLQAYETKISELETKLDELLDAETDRRQKVLSDRTTVHHLQKKQNEREQEARRVTQDDSPHSWSSLSSKDNNCGEVAVTPAFNAAAATRNETSLQLCHECGVMHTNTA